MHTSSKARLVISALLVLAFASCCYWEYRTSDAHRLSLFRAHKPDYESLLKMLQQDRGLTFINEGLTDPEDPSSIGISQERIAEYRRYMSQIGCGAIRYSTELGSALFVSDLPTAADILYFPEHAFKAAGLPATQAPRDSRRIEGDWYLAYER
jgi:hypothetical protein